MNQDQIDRMREAGVKAREERKARGEKIERLTPAEKAKRNPNSRSLAVAHHCWDCSGQDADPKVNWRIGNCEIKDCALFLWRPHQRLFGVPLPKCLSADYDPLGRLVSPTVADR